ncbi:MAG: hypothetical protein IPP56_10495 [Bacteroidetes bacterium]|nr:hypothetical protein [Bacteroidota bacterium]MBK9800107.1 hypothetical protein [Bacteroidota bacterium]
MKLNKLLLTSVLLIGTFTSRAQFVPEFDDSHMPMNQPCEVLASDSSVTKGTLKMCMQMSGKLKSFAVKPDDGSDKKKFKAEDVIIVRMKPSNLQKIAETVNASTKVKVPNVIDCKWIYYEMVKMPKSGSSALLQRLNPGRNNDKLKVYVDPDGSLQTSQISPSTSTPLIGGKGPSYLIVQDGIENSMVVSKKKYKEQFAAIFSGCPDFATKAGDMEWENFPTHVAIYNNSCK